jgi:hypothetical protein
MVLNIYDEEEINFSPPPPTLPQHNATMLMGWVHLPIVKCARTWSGILFYFKYEVRYLWERTIQKKGGVVKNPLFNIWAPKKGTP